MCTCRQITKAQKYLQNSGSKIKVTGQYSIGMRSAIISYQKKHQLLPTGELDKDTWRMLKRENGIRAKIRKLLSK